MGCARGKSLGRVSADETSACRAREKNCILLSKLDRLVTPPHRDPGKHLAMDRPSPPNTPSSSQPGDPSWIAMELPPTGIENRPLGVQPAGDIKDAAIKPTNDE